MYKAESLLDALRSAYAKIAEVEAVVASHPGDRFVLASLHSVKEHAKKLEDNWLEECRINQLEVCRYRLLSRARSYAAAAFAKSILGFQELFSQIYDAKKNRAKRRARVSGEVATETTFGFSYVFPGSLGVALTIADEATLLGGKFEETIKAFHGIADLHDENDVRAMAATLGDAVVKKAYDWSHANYFAGFSVDIVWTGANGIKIEGINQRSMGGAARPFVRPERPTSGLTQDESAAFRPGHLSLVNTLRKTVSLSSNLTRCGTI